jgi:hypothetical protein
MPDEIPVDPVVTLFLPTCKSSTYTVAGRTGRKYRFRRSEKYDGKLAREYFSLEEFEREEIDIRKNTGNLMPVCTLMGSPSPVSRAREAVVSLAAAKRSVALSTRIEALQELSALALAMVEQIKAEQVEATEAQDAADAARIEQETAEAPVEPEPGISFKPDPIDEAKAAAAEATTPEAPASETPAPAANPAAVEASAEAKADVSIERNYSERELMTMPFNEELTPLKKLWGVTENSRKAIAAAILQKQKERK